MKIKISLIFVAAGLLIFVIFSSNLLSLERFIFIREARALFFSKLSIFSSFAAEIKKDGNLINVNLALKNENRRLLSEIAIQADLKEQNDFLRNSFHIQPSAGYKFVDA